MNRTSPLTDEQGVAGLGQQGAEAVRTLGVGGPQHGGLAPLAASLAVDVDRAGAEAGRRLGYENLAIVDDHGVAKGAGLGRQRGGGSSEQGKRCQGSEQAGGWDADHRFLLRLVNDFWSERSARDGVRATVRYDKAPKESPPGPRVVITQLPRQDSNLRPDG